jgi:hypothetical protein
MKAAVVNGYRQGTAARRAAIIRRVRQALVAHQPRAYRLVLDAQSLAKRGDDWLIVVTPDRDSAPLGDSVTRMMAAEDDVRRRWKLNIILLPAMPPEDD